MTPSGRGSPRADFVLHVTQDQPLVAPHLSETTRSVSRDARWAEITADGAGATGVLSYMVHKKTCLPGGGARCGESSRLSYM